MNHPPNPPSPPQGFTQTPAGLHFNGMPVDQYDDGLLPAQRKEHLDFLLSLYTNKWHVYCAHCGQTDQLGNMAVCHTCGNAYCPPCTTRYPQVNNPVLGKGMLCPACRQAERYGVAL